MGPLAFGNFAFALRSRNHCGPRDNNATGIYVVEPRCRRTYLKPGAIEHPALSICGKGRPVTLCAFGGTLRFDSKL